MLTEVNVGFQHLDFRLEEGTQINQDEDLTITIKVPKRESSDHVKRGESYSNRLSGFGRMSKSKPKKGKKISTLLEELAIEDHWTSLEINKSIENCIFGHTEDWSVSGSGSPGPLPRLTL